MSREFIVPKKIIMGENAVADSAEYIKKLGTKALIVTGKHVVKLDCFRSVTEMLDKLGIAYSIFTGITGEPTDKMIDEGLAAYKKEGCDFLIGIGGGSPLDSIKAIAALSANGGKISDYMGKTITGDLPPMAAIPTTAGTGSEATQFTVITDSEKDIKMLLKGTVLIPDIAIIDPVFSSTSPRNITAATGLDALTHAVESYTSRKAQPLTDAVAVSAVKRIFKYLPRAYKDGSDKKAREEMSVAALEAGIAINNASVTIVHGMSRPIGANFHIAHGISNAMLLEKCMSFALDGAYEKFADLGRATGTAKQDDDDKTAAEKFLEGLAEICRICEVPTLAEYGIDKDNFFSLADKMADDAIASGSPANTIKAVTKQDVLNIYSKLW
ncbi:iron-containing alcohol dehydrogenase [Porcipelethomonas sp.]|uniref:iron-containing alcohol dehydrogenase n=1 Tax=Porcipelethomonas sp. TaxID=2981675 RepID=UPI003EF873CB